MLLLHTNFTPPPQNLALLLCWQILIQFIDIIRHMCLFF